MKSKLVLLCIFFSMQISFAQSEFKKSEIPPKEQRSKIKEVLDNYYKVNGGQNNLCKNFNSIYEETYAIRQNSTFNYEKSGGDNFFFKLWEKGIKTFEIQEGIMINDTLTTTYEFFNGVKGYKFKKNIDSKFSPVLIEEWDDTKIKKKQEKDFSFPEACENNLDSSIFLTEYFGIVDLESGPAHKIRAIKTKNYKLDSLNYDFEYLYFDAKTFLNIRNDEAKYQHGEEEIGLIFIKSKFINVKGYKHGTEYKIYYGNLENFMGNGGCQNFKIIEIDDEIFELSNFLRKY